MPRQKTQTEKNTPKVADKKSKQHTSFYEGVGRRKEASAIVRLYVISADSLTLNGKVIKKGELFVNGRLMEQYFPGEVNKKLYSEPFRTTNTVGRFTVSTVITGGGTSSQLGAFIHAVSRALEKVDKEKFRPVLKKRGFLTRDDRIKERRKAGYAQKARAKKQSPKR